MTNQLKTDILIIKIQFMRRKMTTTHSLDVKENIFNVINDWFNSQTKYNQVSLAAALGVTRQSVKRWLTRVCVPDTSLWYQLCDIMNVSIIKFLGIDDNALLTRTENDLLVHYKNDLSFNTFIDRYFADENFKRTIDSLAVLTK